MKSVLKNSLKMKSPFTLLLITLVSLSVNVSCGRRSDNTSKDDAVIERIVGEMSLKEKVCQMFILRPESLVCPEDALSMDVTGLGEGMAVFFSEYPVGGFCLFPKNIVSPAQLVKFTADLHSLSPKPLLCVDEEGGRVARIANTEGFGLKKFESMTALASGNDPQKVCDASLYIGTYVKEYGFDIDFAPVADVNTNPENIVIGPRAFSDNPRTAATKVVSYMQGLKEAGVTGCLKHFPGHGDTKNDTHTGYAASTKTWDEMEACEMVPFKAGIAAGAELIMIAHIAAPNVTGTDVPSTMSPVIIKEKLRGSLGYEGLIITDAVEMGAITQKYSSAEAAVGMVNAGVDIILMPSDFIQAVDGIIKAVGEGRISEKRIDESVCRILSLKQKKGLL